MGRRYFPFMFALAALFALRVLAQAAQAVYPIAVLPPFDAWHGAVLSYPMLLASQIIVLVILVVVLWRVRADAITPSPWKYRTCFALGGVYFVFMCFRLLAGLTFLRDDPWFAKSLPAFFHVVLATFILVLGHYVFKRWTQR